MAMNFISTYEQTEGWHLTVHIASRSELGVVSDRVKYSGLSSAELLDVLEAIAGAQLRD